MSVCRFCSAVQEMSLAQSWGMAQGHVHVGVQVLYCYAGDDVISGKVNCGAISG